MTESSGYKKILIINLGGIGDFLLSTPALRALKNKFKDAKISLLAVPRVCEIAADIVYLERVFPFRMDFGALLQDFSTLLFLRKEKFDLAINMRTIHSVAGGSKVKFILGLIKPAKSVGRNTDNRGKFFDIKIPETLIGIKPEMDYDIDTVKELGVGVDDRSIDFVIPEADKLNASKILKSKSLREGQMLIGLNPGGRSSRRWPIEKFAQVIRSLSNEFGANFILTGSKDEFGLAQRLADSVPVNIINLSGVLNVKELGQVISWCSLYISNDTGPMHIAAILKAPLVAILGPEDIARYDPRKISPGAQVIYKGANCSPCNKFHCRRMQCLDSITVEEVLQSARRLLKGGR